MTNLKRDPFEQNVGDIQKSVDVARRRHRRPDTAYLYDWQMLPIGQLLVAEGTRDLPEVPAAADPGGLQPRRDRENDVGQRQPLAQRLTA